MISWTWKTVWGKDELLLFYCKEDPLKWKMDGVFAMQEARSLSSINADAGACLNLG
jgi:hypothetical protein